MAFSYALLTHQQLLKVEGKDAFTFLQGQLSCDLRDVVNEGSRLGTHCTIKGHAIALFRVMAESDQSFLLRCHHSLIEKALAQLKKYIIFSKATATLKAGYQGIGLVGPDVRDFLATQLSLSAEEIPTQASEMRVTEKGFLCCIQPDRYELWTSQHQFSEIQPLLDLQNVMPIEQWILADIRAGMPDIHEATSEAFIPQMLNLQVFEGVHFKKGCYTGQEIITRLQHRGVLKRPMYRITCHSEQPPNIGSPIHCDDKEGVGQVVLVAPTEEAGCYEMLAVILKDRAEKDQLWLPGPIPVTLLDLPYELDPRLFESKR